MKILVVCQYYYPEPFRINDICEELVKKGHYIQVITSVPNYPMGNIYSEYKNIDNDEVINGVKIHRCKTHPRKKGKINRFRNYYSFVKKSSKFVKQIDKDFFDVVFIYQLSPVMMGKAGILFSKKCKKKNLLYCLDLWPESLTAGGVRRNSLLYKLFFYESKKIYNNVDKLVVSSKSFDQYFKMQFNISKLEYLPQYAEEIFTEEECKKKPDNFIDLMFAGNIGSYQNIMIIPKVARKCLDIKNLRWHIVGDGVELNNLKKECINLPVYFYGRQPLDQMPKYYSKADAMIVTMKKNDILSLTLPGKIQSYMASAKPIIGSIDGEANRIINESNCGLVSNAEDVDAFERIIREFIILDNKEVLGINGKKFYELNFAKSMFIDKLEKFLEEIK